MSGKQGICPKCDSIMESRVCLKCGYEDKPQEETVVASQTKGEASKDSQVGVDTTESETSDEQVEQVSSEEGPQEDEVQPVQSIFTDLVEKSNDGFSAKDPEPQVEKTNKKAKFASAALVAVLFFTAFFSYYRFVYSDVEFISPLVLSAQDIKETLNNPEGNNLATVTDTEKTLDLDSGLFEGNFEKHDFAQFASPNINVFIYTFDLKNTLEKFASLETYEAIKEEFDFSDDDVSIYLSKGFAIIYPDENLNKWGMAIYVEDQEFVEQRVDDFNDKKEDEGYEYVEYNAEIVKIRITEEGNEAITQSALDLVDVEEEEEANDEDSADNEESTDEEESNDEENSEESADNEDITDEDIEYFLLISNSNEFLDEMIEASEGNLANLSEDLEYTQAKTELPSIGEVYVYKKSDSLAWKMLTEIAATKYEYVGLDKILDDIKSAGVVFYTNVDKFKIVGSTINLE